MKKILILFIFLNIFLFPAPDKNYGKIIGNRIEAVESLALGNASQWIYIKGYDISRPVLLFLHGGPGFVVTPLLQKYNNDLESYFIVVNWDQRGAGKSWNDKIPKASMTLEQFVSDAHQLTQVLKNRFNRKKIYLVAHSFGTLIGMLLVDKYPEDYYAYVSIGQVVNFAENEQLSYKYAMEMARQSNQTNAIRQLEAAGTPDKDGNYKDEKNYRITSKWVEYFGGDLYGRKEITDIYREIFKSPIYKDDAQKIRKGYTFSQLLFNDPKVRSIDFRKDFTDLKVPVYFFTGRHDYDTPFELVEQLYKTLKAPQKEMVWFEKSAHFPFYEEPEQFNEMLIKKVLSQTLKQ